jgi:transcriptional regulator with XRE-family HTH domain
MISEERLYSFLGGRLRELREGAGGRRKLTQAELAQLVGLERTSITNIEKGAQKVPLHILYRLCGALQVDISQILPPVSIVQGEAWDLPSISNLGEVPLPPQAAEALSRILNKNK